MLTPRAYTSEACDKICNCRVDTIPPCDEAAGSGGRVHGQNAPLEQGQIANRLSFGWSFDRDFQTKAPSKPGARDLILQERIAPLGFHLGVVLGNAPDFGRRPD
ncbi:hypothetical protein ACK28Q_42415 [Bradyrhizobium japonicum]|uniref:hypothetical protein n=1 Tax=Bradyrhizobium TaxID=374 RepID=UPI000231BD1B|nr:hypothetical protein [Bradyrhizobium japonicum]MCS3988360.1 hypothetical protein [Bradyrhizobium japonicum]MCS4203917.1 hypothetical protein [Bradyrhizobium japonicum]MYV83578.1 hypothetical protein [Bradyrhizobium japonicum]BAL06165.1 hypothetical protein BJ6T_08720 [Bradyrhizobium japonicum USDA 6]GEC50036.1 hypothetical protein BJA01nite_76780 [Bradyrhizobium japonicum]